MATAHIRNVLERLASGALSIEQALRELRHLPFADLGFAKVDHHRELRSGLAEAVLGEGKTPGQIQTIVAELLGQGDDAVLVTRAGRDQFTAVKKIEPEASYSEAARLIVARKANRPPDGIVVVACGGTSDLPVAEEAALVSEALGLKVERLTDVGVAGVHRLLAHQETLDRGDVVIVVAGMEGALPTVVGGLVSSPVIAVPTSVGYGAGGGGITPLLAMLNSCAPGVAVVNIDNGFGAAVFAASILRSRSK